MYESAVTPTETMIPVAPASDSDSPLDWLSWEMMEYSSIPDTDRPSTTTSPRAR